MDKPLVPREGPNLYSDDRERRALGGGKRHPPLEGPEPRQPDGVIRTLIADDHAMFRRGVASCLAGEPDFVVAGEAEDGDTAVRVGMAEQPTLALIDMRLADGDGLRVVNALREASPGDRKSTRLNSSHTMTSRMPSSA